MSMKDQEIKLQCLSITNGNLDQAKAMFEWITEITPFHNFPQIQTAQNAYQSGLKGSIPGAG